VDPHLAEVDTWSTLISGILFAKTQCCITNAIYLNDGKSTLKTICFRQKVFARSRVARFFLVQYTKTGENIPNNHKKTKW
jgi:hypothetical protein